MWLVSLFDGQQHDIPLSTLWYLLFPVRQHKLSHGLSTQIPPSPIPPQEKAKDIEVLPGTVTDFVSESFPPMLRAQKMAEPDDEFLYCMEAVPFTV